MRLIYNFTCLYKYCRFFRFDICLFVNYFTFKDSQNCFCYLYLRMHHAYFLSLNNDIVDIETADGICSPTFVVYNFSRLFLNPFIFPIKDPRSG